MRERLTEDRLRAFMRVKPDKLRELFAAIEPELDRYPAVDPIRFRRAVESIQ